MTTERHLAFVRDFFRREVWVVTEWKDDSVWKRKKVGEVACFPTQEPLRPGSDASTHPKAR